jgi:hypothetical protein
MPQITVMALDSATAMDEIVRRLGMDALIVSTRRVDGQIEIVATNDEIVANGVQSFSKQKSFPSDAAKFSEVLKSKLTDPPDQLSSTKDKYQLIKNIREELRLLEKIVDEPFEGTASTCVALDAFRLAGFKNDIKSILPELDPSITVDGLSKLLAKKFVRGQSAEFDNSDIHFIVGLDKSGKSAFLDKFKKLIEDQSNEVLVHTFKNVTGSADYKNISDLHSRKVITSGKQHVISLAEVNDLGQLEPQLYNFQKQNPSLVFSVINVIEVGRSYDFLIKNTRRPRLENEYTVVSKLDLCDISLPEVSALLELGHKCKFFSGIVQSDEGLYHARVDQVASHLTALVNKQKGI